MKHFIALISLSSLICTAGAADFETAVGDLIPKLADANVPARYGAQMQLQDLASQSSKPGNEADRVALGKVLAAKAVDAGVPQPARVWIVRQLEYMGAAEAVAALTKLLNGDDAELRECARRALEKNGDRAASQSLWDALQKVATDQDAAAIRWKIGLINSLGERRDTAAVGLLVPRLRDAGTAPAAALALGKIANSAAVDALWSAAGSSTYVSEALIEAGNRLAAGGDPAGAGAIYQRLFAQDQYAPARAAALAGVAKVNPAAAAPLINEALAGTEPRLQFAAIAAAATAFGPGATAKLMPLYPKLGPSAKAMVLGVVDASAEPQIIEAVADANEGVRRAAIDALGRVGGAAGVPVLLQAFTAEGKPGKSNAEAALAKISGQGAAAALEEYAATGDSKARVACINALAARKYAPAVPALLKYATETDSSIRKASFNALGQMGGEAELPPVARLAASGKHPEASAALEAIAGRASNKSAAAKQLLAVGGNNEQALASLLDALSAVGGDEALTAVTKLSASPDAQVREDAVRALGNWADFAAVKPLLSIASDKDAKLNLYILAMQGVARLVKSTEAEPVAARADTALTAFNAARRDEEKKLMLSALGTVPHARVVAALKPLLADATFKAEAGLAAVALAETLSKTDKAAATDLAKAIVAADVSRDVTRRANRLLR